QLPPHIFQLANNAYCRTTQDQSFVFSCRQVRKPPPCDQMLLELSVSDSGKKGPKLATQIPAPEFVLESFGNARTFYNPN
ncbi:hypothetical protein C8R45DRAFT_779823, partial [Mycena sanguinolenta]